MRAKKKKWEPLRSFTRVIHSPTYCYLQAIDPITDKPPYYERHKLSAFSRKQELQSGQSAKRLQQAINWMLLFALPKRVFSKKSWINKAGKVCHSFSFKLSFITLTLSSEQKHSDTYIKEHMLQPFLLWMQRNYKASYVWKSEAQLNGNIHFHITTDVFIHWKSIRAKWNNIQQKHGYIKTFQEGIHNEDPNSIDVHCVKNEKDVAKYLATYCSKKSSITEKDWEKIQRLNITPQFCWCIYDPKLPPQAQNKTWYRRIITGRLWGCSEALSKIKCFLDEEEGTYNLAAIEKTFFHDNNLRRLSSVLITEAKKKKPDMSTEQELELNKKYFNYRNTFIHRNLKYCKLPEVLRDKLAAEREKRNFTNQTSFKVEAL